MNVLALIVLLPLVLGTGLCFWAGRSNTPRRRSLTAWLAAAVTAQALSVDRLVDMEWRFGVTASTSELKSVGATFLQLKLVLEKRDGGGAGAVHLELTLPQFYEFLGKMEKCQAYMDYLADA